MTIITTSTAHPYNTDPATPYVDHLSAEHALRVHTLRQLEAHHVNTVLAKHPDAYGEQMANEYRRHYARQIATSASLMHLRRKEQQP